MIDNHIDNNSILSLVLQQKEKKVNYMKKFREKIIDVFGIDFEHNNRVVYYKKHSLEENKSININNELLVRCPKINFLLRYLDAGFYIFNESIFDILESKAFTEKTSKLNMESLRDDFIPFLIKNTYSTSLNKILIDKYQNQILKANKIKIFAKLIQNEENINSEYVYKIYDYPSYISTIEEIQKPYDKIKPIFFQTKNNTKNYFENFRENIIQNLENNKKYNDNIPELQLISEDSYIADKINSLNQSAEIKKTVSDQNLKVAENSEIVECIIGLDSEIGKNCKLKKCIIGNNVNISDGSKITECVIGDNYNFKNENENEISDKILF